MVNLHKLLGIKYPIIQGAMANISNGAFAAAVSNAGGLGIIATGGMNAEELRTEIKICKEKTSNLFGVNIMLLNPDIENIAKMVVEENVQVLTTGAGNPAVYMKMWNEAGIKVIPVVPSVSMARLVESKGAFAVIAEGTESGGHVGELTTMVLVPQVVGAVSIPVIAAGGIASGEQLVATFALGACGVQVGTCLLTTEECPVHENYKNAVIKAKDTSTIVTGRTVGVPVRVIKNTMARQYVKMEKDITDKMELEALTLGSLRKAVKEGDVQMGSLMAGQVSGQIKEISTIEKVFENMLESAKNVMANLGGGL